MKKMIVAIALMGFVSVANAGEGDVVFGGAVVAAAHQAIGATQFVHTYVPIGMLAPVVHAVLTHEPCANSNAPVKYVKQDGANYFTSVAGCEAKYSK